MPIPAVEDSPQDRLAILFGQRYGQRQGETTDTTVWTETIETLLSHRSVRSYLSQPVPATALELAVAAAQSASTSSNLQAWSVIAVEDKERKSRINAIAGQQRQVDQAPLLLIFLADLSRLRRVADGQGSTSDGLDFLEAFLLAVIDAALAVQNASTALESIGLGTCYIGAVRNDPDFVARELGLPDLVFPVFGLTVGYPDPAIKTDVKPRLPQSTVLHRERYSNNPTDVELYNYNETLRAFQRSQSMALIDWSDQASGRIATREALKNRDRLSDVLRGFGFQLR